MSNRKQQTKRTCVIKELNEEFNPKEIVLGEVCAPSECGKMVQNSRMAIATKDMIPPRGFKDHSPRPDLKTWPWRSHESFLYLTLKDANCLGIYPSFDGKGFDIVVSLSSLEDSLEAGENDHAFKALDGMHKRTVELLLRRKEDLPEAFAEMKDEQLEKAVRPIYSEGYVNKKGVKRGPSLRVGFKFFAEYKDKKDPKKNRKENMMTKCEVYDGVDDDGDDVYRDITNNMDEFRELVSDIDEKKFVFGRVDIAIRVLHLGFSIRPDKKTGKINKTINVGTELVNMAFKPSEGGNAEEPDMLGHKTSKKTRSESPPKDDIPELVDVDDHYEDEDEEPRSTRKSRNDEDDEEPKSRKSRRDDDEEEESEEKPRKSRKSRR